MTKPWRSTVLAGCLLILGAIPQARAQKAAERYIPLGQSPGLSGQFTLMGVIRHADPASGRVTLELHGGGAGSITVAPETRIWIDHSGLRKTNVPGGFADLTPGLLMEAMPQGAAPHRADWVKVEPGGP